MHVGLARAAKDAGVNRTTVYRWIRRGHVSGHKGPDGEWTIDASELQRFIDSRTDTHARAQQDAQGSGDAGTESSKKETQPVQDVAPVRASDARARLALLEAEVAMLRERLEETKAERERRVDELSADRDRWAAQAERLALAPPAPEPASEPQRQGLLARMFGRAA